MCRMACRACIKAFNVRLIQAALKQLYPVNSSDICMQFTATLNAGFCTFAAVGELICSLFSNLKAAWADTWAERGNHVFNPPTLFDHLLHTTIDDRSCCTAPAGMNCSNDARFWICQQNRQAICGTNTQSRSRLIAYQDICFIWVYAARPDKQATVCAVNLLYLMRQVRKPANFLKYLQILLDIALRITETGTEIETVKRWRANPARSLREQSDDVVLFKQPGAKQYLFSHNSALERGRVCAGHRVTAH